MKSDFFLGIKGKNSYERNFGDLRLQQDKLIKYSPRIHQVDMSIVRMQMLCNHSSGGLEKNDKNLAHGTAFLVEFNERKHLVTCWHNLTGLHHETRDWTSTAKTFPTHVAYQHTVISPTGNVFNRQRIPIYDSDGYPVWRVHKSVKNYYDIAVFDLDDSAAPQPVPAFSISDDSIIGSISQRTEIFVAGYPTHDFSNQFIPIWKRGSIASTPQLPYAGHPKFLIDCSTRAGMSGAPVFLQNQENLVSVPFGKSNSFNTFNGPLLWIGMYSAREYTSDKSNSSELGFVWRKDEIIDVIVDGIRDCIPEPGIKYPKYKYVSPTK